jgi:hypothetical protein
MSNVPTNLIPTRISQLPEAPVADPAGYFPIVISGTTYKVQFSQIQGSVEVPASRRVNAGTGLTGGGSLSADITIAVADGGIGDQQLDVTGVSAGTYGSGANVPVITVNTKGRVTSLSTTPLVVSGYVPDSRQIVAGTGLSGGGNLSADRTLAINFSSATPQPLGLATAGTGVNAARDDHVHPAVDLSDATETTGALPMGRGGTGTSLSPVAGALVFSNGTNLDLTSVGTIGQVLRSTGTTAPVWSDLSAGTVRTVDMSTTVSGLSFSGSPITVSGTITLAGTVGIASGGTGATTAPNARTNLGLGTMAVQDANSVSISGGSINVSTLTSSSIISFGTISETVGGTQYLVASQYDVGTAPNQIPLNQYLGTMAFQDAAGVSIGLLSATTANAASGTITNLVSTSATITNLVATSLTLANLSITSANITTLTSGSATLTNLTSTSGTVTTLASTSATVTNLNSTSANITTLTGTTFGTTATTQLRGASAQITQLDSTSATITTLTSTSGTITTLGSTSANITTLSGTTATFTSATITNLALTSLTLGNLSVGSANITTLTGTNLTYTSGTVANLNSTSANITTLTGTTFGTTATTQLRGASAQITTLTATSANITTLTGTTLGTFTSGTVTNLSSTSANITTLTGTTFGTTATTQLRGASGQITTLTVTSANITTLTGSSANITTITENSYNVASQFDVGTAPNQLPLNQYLGTMAFQDSAGITVGQLRANGTDGIGYATGAGSAVTQATSRTTGVTINAACGAITLVSAAGTTSWQTFTVTNSAVAATDTIVVNQKSGTDLNMIHVTNVAAGSFKISFATTGGTTTEQPVFNFAVIKAVAA